jgi:hypothetical protein
MTQEKLIKKLESTGFTEDQARAIIDVIFELTVEEDY